MDTKTVLDWLFKKGAYAKNDPVMEGRLGQWVHPSPPVQELPGASFASRFRGYQPRFADRLDPNKQAMVEDRTKMTPQERENAEAFSFMQGMEQNLPKQPVPNQGGIANQAGMGDIQKYPGPEDNWWWKGM